MSVSSEHSPSFEKFMVAELSHIKMERILKFSQQKQMVQWFESVSVELQSCWLAALAHSESGREEELTFPACQGLWDT